MFEIGVDIELRRFSIPRRKWLIRGRAQALG
jgi:hypothetical protein